MDQTKSYPDQVRGLAEDIDCAETMSEYDFVSSRLRQLADELEELLKQKNLYSVWGITPHDHRWHIPTNHNRPRQQWTGMTLQREYLEGGRLIWRDIEKDGQVMKSPVDIDALPAGKYRLI